MTNLNIITRSVHQAKAQIIQPIDVIEGWSLSYHLACVVNCIARAGRNSKVVEELKKAEWYLVREIVRYKESGEVCRLPLGATTCLLVNRICEDWGLSDNLWDVLDHIRASKIPIIKIGALLEALTYLRDEIKHHELLGRGESLAIQE